ncbi:acetate/propionate family kinase [Geofilum sp. OHC36d9]|uniref:acetate/propionate family kinase n=1 Tax=Geofilum sp. OHC36d9 TaxID=3458413 RepID=UPI0040338E0E
MNVLVLNCGSSSLKYRIIKMPVETDIVNGEAQRVGIKSADTSFITHTVKGQNSTLNIDLPTHVDAFKKVLQLIFENHKNDEDIYFDCIAHRYVNSGEHFSGASRIFPEDLEKLQETFDITPLHGPIIYEVIKFCSEEYRDIPQYILADNGFHSNIPAKYSTYALPLDLIKKHHIKRMGYHGISHQYVMQEACNFLDQDAQTLKIISCHLGTGGSSVCAIQFGKSVNSSMGFTPLEGLMMNTRSGDIDAGMIFNIMYNNGLNASEAENILNKKSGVLSIFKESSDLRDALKGRDKNPNAEMALEMYVRRIKKYIGNYMIQLKKADVLIFTDTLGIGMPAIRNAICKGMEYFGIRIDKHLNKNYQCGILDVSMADSEVKILIVPNNEELMIAREVFKKMSSSKEAKNILS